MRPAQTVTVDAAEDGVRLDRWFKRHFPEIGHVQVQKLARSGQIRVDGSRAKADSRLAAGAQVRVPPLPEPQAEPKGGRELSDRDIAFARSLVLYEDETVLALNKPSGLAVQGGTKTTRHVDGLLDAFGSGVSRPRLVHRLDRDTSGVLLLGKGPAAAASLAEAFARRLTDKTYWAITSGAPEPAEGVVTVPLAKRGFGDREMVMVANPDDADAESAETEYETVAVADGAAWLEVHPYTGRTHQIRVHLKSLGHPILGDPKYGEPASQALSQGLKLQLHARRLVIPHPNGRKLRIEAPLGEQMRAGFKRFGFDKAAAPGGRRR